VKSKDVKRPVSPEFIAKVQERFQPVIPTTVEGEVLAYEGHNVIVRADDSMPPQAWRVPIPRDAVWHFDLVPARALYDDGTPGASVSMDFATVGGVIDYKTLIGLRVKGNGPNATWRTVPL
jgi:hypothetical protein